MNIDESLLSKLEKLSSLKISEENRANVMSELSDIVQFVEVLNELDLSHDKAISSAVSGSTTLRDDIAKPSHVIDEILEHAPASNGHFFVVPKIIE